MEFTKKQISIIREIEKFVGRSQKRYDFWFTDNGWEGGFELGGFDGPHFRNQYSILGIGEIYQITKNW